MEPTPTRGQHARVDDPRQVQMEPGALQRRGDDHGLGGDDHGGDDPGGFDFPIPGSAVSTAARMEAPAAPDALEDFLRMTEAELREVTLAQEAQVATMKETYEELVQCSLTGDTPQRSRMSVPPAHGHAHGDSLCYQCSWSELHFSSFYFPF